MDKIDWDEIERWIEEDLIEDEDERRRYCANRDMLRKRKEADNMSEEVKNTNIPRTQITLHIPAVIAQQVKEYCAEHKITMSDFGTAALRSALTDLREAEAAPRAPMKPTETEAEAETAVETTETSLATPTRSLILDVARQIVCADRDETYGSAEDNFGIIAELWKPYLKGRGIAADNLTSMDVAILMIQLKVARVATGKFKLDNFVDICGYAACGGECGGRHD